MRGEPNSPETQAPRVHASFRQSCETLGVCQALNPRCGACDDPRMTPGENPENPDDGATWDSIAFYGAVVLLSVLSGVVAAGLYGVIVRAFP